MKSTIKTAAMVVFFAVIAVALVAFAHDGYGGHMMGPGYGGYMMGPSYGGHMGWWGDEDDRGLTQDQAEKLEAARESFYRDNRALQDQIYDKSAELSSEFSKQNPDREKLSGLQNELSRLETQFDQKRLDYQLQVRKIFPQADQGYAEGYRSGEGWCWR